MKAPEASGLQAAFLVFAVTLLSVPLADLLLAGQRPTPQEGDLVRRAAPFFLGGLVILAVPGLRAAAVKDLSTPVPEAFRWEVACVAVAKLALPFAAVAAFALWIDATEGVLGLERRLAVSGDAEMARAFGEAAAWSLLVTGFAAPIMEELVFRGFLHRAFERRWGWTGAVLATSTLFGLYHAAFFNAFFMSVLLACVLRRAGSLWAPIAVHAFGNLMLWYPLTGRFLLPERGEVAPAATWTLHIACLAFAALALPAYFGMSRARRLARAPHAPPHAALPQ